MNSGIETDYCLPPDYETNPLPPMSDDHARERIYWTPSRIRLSRCYQHDVYRLARQLAEENNARVVCDVGCGPGTKLMHFFGQSFNVIGIDRSEAVDFCRQAYERGRFLVADLERDVTSDSFDVSAIDLVICADVIEHLARPERLLSFLSTLVGESGIIVISTPERDRLHGRENRKPANSEHVREWNEHEFAEFLHSQGFDIVQHLSQPQLRLSGSLSAWLWAIRRWVTGRTIVTNQIVVCRPSALKGASRHNA